MRGVVVILGRGLSLGLSDGRGSAAVMMGEAVGLRLRMRVRGGGKLATWKVVGVEGVVVVGGRKRGRGRRSWWCTAGARSSDSLRIGTGDGQRRGPS